ncbi:MAG: YdcF family protein [Leptolyngbyaceae cyanobacterium SM1_3_5]|nr:YdcF family protein [Leptolyngbyaceae cyanobacterium SM1_3_5]
MRSRTAFNSSPRRSIRHKGKKLRLWPAILAGLTVLMGYDQIRGWLDRPQAILVLGGSPDREVFAADFALDHPDLPIWVSSGSNPEYADAVFADAGIDPQRIHLDYEAIDTVTNFTTLVDQFKAQGIDNIYLVTSDFHMRRARVIGTIVLGSRGIDFEPIAIPSDRPPESIDKAIRDGARAVLWVTTGQTGSEIGEFFSQHFR